jgi:threonine dehydratase
MPHLITLADILAARDRIASTAVRTPLLPLSRRSVAAAGFPALSETMPEIYLKDESAQPIKSFKLRGAYNMIAQLSPEQLECGVITYSSGNHAQGVAFSARALGAKAVIVMPSTSPQIKLDATAALGAEIVLVGPASSERRRRAEALAAEHGYTIVPPYDDDAIIAGQATCGLEILEQLPEVDMVLSPVSGGGLLSGVAAAIKLALNQHLEGARLQPCHADPMEEEGFSPGGVQVFGCEPALAADAKQSFDTRTLTEWDAAETTRTLCDGLRTQSLGERNFEHILHFVDGIVTISEDEIRTALRILLEATSLVPEPSGSITLAAALFHAHEMPGIGPGSKVAAIVSGGNLDPALRRKLQNESASAPV